MLYNRFTLLFMELKDFISQTLVEIQGGVQDAINTTIANKTMGAINPVWGTSDDIHRRDLQTVDFDIAVTVSDKTTGEANAGIKVAVFKIGGEASGSTKTSNVSRIQFSIPIIPPMTTITGTGGKKTLLA